MGLVMGLEMACRFAWVSSGSVAFLCARCGMNGAPHILRRWVWDGFLFLKCFLFLQLGSVMWKAVSARFLWVGCRSDWRPDVGFLWLQLEISFASERRTPSHCKPVMEKSGLAAKRYHTSRSPEGTSPEHASQVSDCLYSSIGAFATPPFSRVEQRSTRQTLPTLSESLDHLTRQKTL